jgi:hypothetical protein
MKIFFVFIAIINFLFAYQDLGTYGELKDIKERDLMDLFNERANALDYKKIEEDIKQNIQKSFVIKSNIPTCNFTKQRVFEPLVEITEDVKIPYTDIKLKEKHSKYNVLKENNIFIPFNIIFIDSNDELQVELARYYKYQLGNKLEIYLVKGDITSLKNENIFDDIKVAREGLELKAFNLQCVPSIYTQKEYVFNIVEYNPKDLKKDEVIK